MVPDLSLKTSSQSETINKVIWEWRRLDKEELYALQIPLTKHYPGDQIKEKEVSRLCETHGETEEVHTVFWWGDLRERNHLEDLCVDGRITLNGWGGMDWNYLAQDREKRLALLMAVMNIWFP